MKIYSGCLTVDAKRLAHSPAFYIEAYAFANLRVKYTIVSSGVNDRLDFFRPYRALLGQTYVGIENGAIGKSIAVWKFCVRDFLAQSESECHCAGVLIIVGSSTPASSHFATTSLYVSATATIFNLSSDSAIHAPKGAVRSNSRRMSSWLSIDSWTLKSTPRFHGRQPYFIPYCTFGL